MKKKQDDLNAKFAEGTMGNAEYEKSTRLNKEALDELALSHIDVQKGLDIINDKQTNYKQKVEGLNGLKLSTSEYDKLISALQSVQKETLKAIQLQQELLKSKIAGLSAPTPELKKASADLNQSFNPNLLTGEGGLSTNRNSTNMAIENGKFSLKLTDAQISAQKEYEAQVKSSNQKNSAEVQKYNAELEALNKQQAELVKIGREAQDIITKPSG